MSIYMIIIFIVFIIIMCEDSYQNYYLVTRGKYNDQSFILTLGLISLILLIGIVCAASGLTLML